MTLVILFAVLGGLWRRALGGWLGLPRWSVVAASPLCAILVLAWHGPWTFVLVAAASVLYWTPGHDFSDNLALWRRYGPVGLAWTMCRALWPSSWKIPGMVTGWTEAAEIAAGFLFYGAVNGVALLTG